MRTLTVKQGEHKEFFPAGWHTLEISKAKYGTFQDSKFIDVYFSEYPTDTLSLRVYAKTGENGEEFAIGRLFRFANAGITAVSKSDDGEAIVTLDDKTDNLLGKKINVYFYKNEKGYTNVLTNVAPTEFSNDLENFSINDIDYWKERAEAYYTKFIANKKDKANGSFVSDGSTSDDVKVVDSVDDIPW